MKPMVSQLSYFHYLLIKPAHPTWCVTSCYSEGWGLRPRVTCPIQHGHFICSIIWLFYFFNHFKEHLRHVLPAALGISFFSWTICPCFHHFQNNTGQIILSSPLSNPKNYINNKQSIGLENVTRQFGSEVGKQADFFSGTQEHWSA